MKTFDIGCMGLALSEQSRGVSAAKEVVPPRTAVVGRRDASNNHF
jgi:hypothetical protein